MRRKEVERKPEPEKKGTNSLENGKTEVGIGSRLPGGGAGGRGGEEGEGGGLEGEMRR